MKRGRIQTLIALLFGYNGWTGRTRVAKVFCGVSGIPAKKHTDFLELNTLIERVPVRGVQYTFKRTEVGELVVQFLLDGPLTCFISQDLVDLYNRSEEERKLSKFKARPSVGRACRSFDIQKISALNLLKHGAKYPKSKIASYSLVSQENVESVMDALEEDGLVILYPNDYKTSKGDYGISSEGRAFILDRKRKGGTVDETNNFVR